jgi:hypothetical protein
MNGQFFRSRLSDAFFPQNPPSISSNTGLCSSFSTKEDLTVSRRPRKPVDPSRVGLFSASIQAGQRRGLRRMGWSDLRFEVAFHRCVAGLVAPLLVDQLTRPSPDSKEALRLSSILAMNTHATAAAARAHDRLNAKRLPLDDLLSAALEDVPFDLPPDLLNPDAAGNLAGIMDEQPDQDSAVDSPTGPPPAGSTADV